MTNDRTYRPHRAAALVVGATLAITACGSSTEDSTADDTATPATATATEVDAGADTTATPEPTAPEVDEPAASTWPAAESIVAFAPLPAPLGPVEAAATPQEHFASMVAALVTAGSDNRLLDGELAALFGFRAQDALPDVFINSLSAGASLNVEAMDIIAAYTIAGEAAGYDGASADFFGERIDGAIALAERFRALHDISDRATGLGLAGRQCFAQLDDSDRPCDSSPKGTELIGAFEEVSEERLQLPSDVSTGRFSPFDVCAAWDAAVADFDPQIVATFESIIDDSIIDTRFLGRSECRRDATGEEDVEIDLEPGTAAFTAVYDAIAAVPVGDVATVDTIPSDDEMALQRDILIAAAEAARSGLDTVVDPLARFGLVAIALRSEREADLAGRILDGTALLPDDERFACIGPEFDLSACDPIITDSFNSTFLYGGFSADRLFPDSPIDFRDIDRRYDLCELWDASITDLPDPVDDAVSPIDEIFGMDEC